MRAQTLYYSQYRSEPFYSEENALEHEKEYEDDLKRMADNSPETKLKLLKAKLDDANYIAPGTLGTCSYDCMRIKGMVHVCEEFAKEHAEYKKYY